MIGVAVDDTALYSRVKYRVSVITIDIGRFSQRRHQLIEPLRAIIRRLISALLEPILLQTNTVLIVIGDILLEVIAVGKDALLQAILDIVCGKGAVGRSTVLIVSFNCGSIVDNSAVLVKYSQYVGIDPVFRDILVGVGAARDPISDHRPIALA